MDSSLICCPFCPLTLPVSEIQQHANTHFDSANDCDAFPKFQYDYDYDDDYGSNFTKGPSFCSTPSSSSRNEPDFGFGRLASTTSSCVDDKISCLISLQSRGSFHRIENGIVPLLKSCLEHEARQERDITFSILSGHVDHFQSTISEDVGWGCGWRNIQMLCSHLLSQRQEMRNVLFGGSGLVPDIPVLQRWLEIAWEKGFDVPGSQHFNQTIYGSAKKIGTSECAALLRSFGIRARIVDFSPKALLPLYLSVPGTKLELQGKRKPVQVCGPMDKYISKTKCLDNDRNTNNQSYNAQTALTKNLAKNGTSHSKGSQILVDWVWNYFSEGSIKINANQSVVVSNKAPLYFQHDGHSRTIVGIQVKHQWNGMQQYTLLVLDPGHSTEALEKSLKEKLGWQKLIKRGVHTLKKPQYQLCFIDPGIASMREMEQLRKLDSTFIEL
ncbi:hypothetical protein ACFE04_016685 [Oxalis oulophora]